MTETLATEMMTTYGFGLELELVNRVFQLLVLFPQLHILHHHLVELVLFRVKMLV